MQNLHSLPKRWLAAALLGLALGFANISTAFALDINTATAAELQTLKGVGPKRAEAIISYRKEHGPFSSPEELMNIKGIGQALLDSNVDMLKLSAAAETKAETMATN